MFKLKIQYSCPECETSQLACECCMQKEINNMDHEAGVWFNRYRQLAIELHTILWADQNDKTRLRRYDNIKYLLPKERS